jgi:hypothetical protein
MRINSEPRSPFFWQKFFNNPSVKLDGVEQEDVVEADDVAGTVTCIAKDSAGNPVHAGGQYIMVCSHGKVEITEQKEEKKND